MLKLQGITKTYETGGEKVEALKGIDIEFRNSEFVSILGQSGCGKTTLLNIIGGLDRYTTGDLTIDGISTKEFKDRDWDAYRNYKVGFVFQSYNLIGHQTILSNVELALTIGGISKKERKERAIKALEDVGLKDQIHKKPSQLSGGQMQRVAIARALVNNPEIILADEPTGALDTKTSVQIMEILKEISKDRLIIMVTHNPELAEKYSTRIVKLVDGVVTEDSNPITESGKQMQYGETTNSKIGKTAMSFFTAFRLSLNNLLTKKGRTILVAFAGSIGIIGIALVQAVSNGFQSYVDHIQEDTLTSYPLTITEETTDISGVLLAMTAENEKEAAEPGTIEEEQYISKMWGNLSTNDLKSFRKHIEENYQQINDDLTSIQYAYSVEPLIYTKGKSKKISKVNPSNLFNTPFRMGLMGASTSVYSQMIDDKETLANSYDVLAGRWPEKYDEMIVVLSEKNSISDLLVYSLGLRDMDELREAVNKIMNGEKAELNNEPMKLTYEDLMNIDLKLIMPTDTYQYNQQYKIYEDMTENDKHMKDLYEKATSLKIVGVVTEKEGVTSAALEPGVAYTSDLIDHIIDYSAKSDIVKKQLANEEVDVLSGKRFDDKGSGLDLDFKDLVSVDKNKLQSVFNMKFDQKQLQKQTAKVMNQMMKSVSKEAKNAQSDITGSLNKLTRGLFKNIKPDITSSQVDSAVDSYLKGSEANKIINSLEKKYGIPKKTFKNTYAGLLKGALQMYINASKASESGTPGEIDQNAINQAIASYQGSAAMGKAIEAMVQTMSESIIKKAVGSQMGTITSSIAKNFASSFNVDPNKITSAFKMKMTEEEITRIVTAMLSKTDTTAKTNLTSFGYQPKDEPTYIAFYFRSFDGKEHFLDFINQYNEQVKAAGDEDKEINYTDTTGILMGSVKTIVNAVTYVLIAFISISLVVSSIMIGIITYISVYERTKEIGILRAIGASKHNISSIFNAETFIIGLLSGLFGIGVTYALIPPINKILHHFAGDVPLDATFYFKNAVVLVILSIILTLIGGLIPAKAASKKDPAVVLRSE